MREGRASRKQMLIKISRILEITMMIQVRGKNMTSDRCAVAGHSSHKSLAASIANIQSNDLVLVIRYIFLYFRLSRLHLRFISFSFTLLFIVPFSWQFVGEASANRCQSYLCFVKCAVVQIVYAHFGDTGFQSIAQSVVLQSVDVNIDQTAVHQSERKLRNA